MLQAEASDIKLVFHSSTITMMHGPINMGGGGEQNQLRVFNNKGLST